MTDTKRDCDTTSPQDSSQDTFDPFVGVSFSDPVDSDFETRLERDFPLNNDFSLEEDLDPSEQYATTEDADDVLPQVAQQADFSNGAYSEQLPFDPMQAYNTYQLANTDQDDLPADGMDWSALVAPNDSIDPSLLNHSMLTSGSFPSQANPLANLMGTQFSGQQMAQVPMSLLQQLLGNSPVNGQQMTQQPMGDSFVNYHQMAQQPIGQGYPQGGWQTQQQLMQPGFPQSNQQPIPEPVSDFFPPTIPQQPIQQPFDKDPRLFVDLTHRRSSDIPTPPEDHRYPDSPPTPGLVTTQPPIRRPAANHHGELLLNDKIPRKTHGNKGPKLVEPERYYGPSPAKPRDWGPKDERGKHLFTYTEKGELSAGLFLTKEQMRWYLLGPTEGDNFEAPARLPGVKRATKAVRQGLTLWIGWPAAMSNSRYPRGGESTKCRFEDCMYNNTISLGEPWVIFDERQNVDGEYIDPFHNAGYVHLYCLEHHFDLVRLWHWVDTRPDYRTFKRESHPYFNLGYKLPGIEEQVRDWWINAFKIWTLSFERGQKPPQEHNISLTKRLVDFKLLHEPKAQAKNRHRRGGVDISKHHGDPELKKRLLKFRKFGLLDLNGYPVANADGLLEQMEAQQRLERRANKAASKNSQPIPYPPQQDTSQQSHPPAQSNVLVDLTSSPEPMYGTQPMQQDTMPVNQPITLNPSPEMRLIPSAPAETAGHKRSADEIAEEDANIGSPVVANQDEPPPKRQRLEENAPASPQPVIGTVPIDIAAPSGDADIGMQDTQPRYLEMQDGLPRCSIEDFHDLRVDIAMREADREVDNGDLAAPQDAQEADNGKLASSTDEHADTSPEAEANASDSDGSGNSSESLFGKSEESR
ncbi:hypothetical protein F5Y10DRAFT_293772 [Nemania abortiva]|nr:hypothetical protein F5Y10DRAFT_293772 [Nemania abortiva]